LSLFYYSIQEKISGGGRLPSVIAKRQRYLDIKELSLMQARLLEQPMLETEQPLAISEPSSIPDTAEMASESHRTRFANSFADTMAMNADVKTVAQYLDQHQDWFIRCAQPMQVESLSRDGYAITIGRFNSFGYVVEPKVGLELLPQQANCYPIKTIEIPDYQPPGYEVDFNAKMSLVEVVKDDQLFTQVDWTLDLAVYIQFPKFIHKLPQSMIQKTGDKLLQQIVRQVSKRLTLKVQKDFHGNAGIPMIK
jgi:hypothetical protein